MRKKKIKFKIYPTGWARLWNMVLISSWKDRLSTNEWRLFGYPLIYHHFLPPWSLRCGHPLVVGRRNWGCWLLASLTTERKKKKGYDDAYHPSSTPLDWTGVWAFLYWRKKKRHRIRCSNFKLGDQVFLATIF